MAPMIREMYEQFGPIVFWAFMALEVECLVGLVVLVWWMFDKNVQV
jgi:hypothetical protein